MLLVGNCTIGPTPQIIPWDGGRKERGKSVADAARGADRPVSAGIQMTGMIVRVMRFQSVLISIGITGWMFRMFCVPLSGPTLKLVLFWNGTLIRLATGFCASFASSSVVISARAGAAAKSSGSHGKADRPDFVNGGLHRRSPNI